MIATINRPPKEEVRDLETQSLTLEEQQRIPALIEKAQKATEQKSVACREQFVNIGELYLLLVANGDKAWQGLTFKDICQENEFFKKSPTRCYELGQAYQERAWALAQYENGVLSYDPEDMSASCFQALRRLEIEDRTASQVEEAKIDVLEEAWAIAQKRAKKRNLAKAKVQEDDIHDAIGLVEKSADSAIARPRRKKASSESLNISRKEAEGLQVQLREQGKQLREEREKRLLLQEQLDREVELRVRAQLAKLEQKLREETYFRQQIASERNTLAEENQALKEQLSKLQREERSEVEPLLEATKKNSTTLEENRTNQLTPTIVEVVPSDRKEEIAELIEKKQKQGFDLQFVEEDLVSIQGVCVRPDALMLERLIHLDNHIVEALAFVRQEVGEAGIFKSQRTYYWSFPDARGSGNINDLSGAILKSLGMSQQEYEKAIAEFRAAA